MKIREIFHNKAGFALIEVLIAMVIITFILTAIFAGISTGVKAVGDSGTLTSAICVARNEMNNFIINNYRGTDIKDEAVEEYPGYRVTRITERYEHPLFGPINAKRTTVIVKWDSSGQEKEYTLSHIYPVR